VYALKLVMVKPARSVRSSPKEGSLARFAFGMAQMFLAGVAAVLLVETGPSAVTLGATCLATALTVTSRWRYHRQRR
jgi:hypothetical protein